MINKIKMTLGILLLVNLSACSTTKLVYVEPKPFGFKRTVEPKPRTIRVHKVDTSLYKAYIDKLREQIRFHNSQIDDYLASFDNKEISSGLKEQGNQ